MADQVTRDELALLETRVSVVEQEVDGEKMVTRHVLEQTRRNSDDLAAILTRLERIETRLDGTDTRVTGAQSALDRVERKIDRMAREFPKTVADVLREVLNERDRR